MGGERVPLDSSLPLTIDNCNWLEWILWYWSDFCLFHNGDGQGHGKGEQVGRYAKAHVSLLASGLPTPSWRSGSAVQELWAFIGHLTYKKLW